ncbi:MAG: NAD-dependent dehydratase [Nitrosomonas sp.]|jgi:nucleoside-diphosphate-sugar epimerase|nr:MAG: NAD-dependent dehydratase [Nitrosomonas sp.]
MKKTLLIIGCGDVARRVAPLLNTRYRILGLCRNPENSSKLRQHGIIPLSGDLDHPKTLNKLAGSAQMVLHLAPPANHGVRDTRTANLLAALTRQFSIRYPRAKTLILPQRLVYISTSGVYGNCDGALIDETRLVNPGSERALRRINAERQIRHWGKRNQVNISILRVPGIYAANRLPLKRLRDAAPVLSPEDDSYTNHIHANDLARIICSALRYAKHGRIYHACDDSHLKMGEYFDLVADRFGLSRPPRIKRNQADGLISPAMLSYMDESRRLTNNRMKRELHITLHYPTVFEGISN